MEASPLVSVIVPTYNRSTYLKETLDSIAKQTYKNIEILVVDDGSPSNEILLLCKKSNGVQYFKIENSGGPAKPRNIGIKEANGDYIAFVDDDDLWQLDKIEKQVAVLNSYPEFGLVHGPCEVMDEFGKKTGEIIGRPGTPEVKHGDVKMRMVGNWTLMTASVMLRKELLDFVGFFKEDMPPAGEDAEFWTRCAFHTKFYYLEEPLVLYRKHAMNISGNNKDYVHLPLYLFDIILEKKTKGFINEREFKKLQYNLVQMQLKQFSLNKIITLYNVNKMDPYWYIHRNNIKLLLKKIIK